MVGERLQQPQNIDAYAQSLSVQDLADRGTGSPVPSDDRMLQARLQPLPGPEKAGAGAQRSAQADRVRPDQGTDGAEVRRGVFAGDTTPPFGAIGHGPVQGVQEFLRGSGGLSEVPQKGETDAPLISISQLTKLRTCQ